jgi:hypothetical protein
MSSTRPIVLPPRAVYAAFFINGTEGRTVFAGNLVLQVFFDLDCPESAGLHA